MQLPHENKREGQEKRGPRDDSDLFMLLFCLMCFDVFILLVAALYCICIVGCCVCLVLNSSCLLLAGSGVCC